VRCERLRDMWPIASAVVPLSDLLADVIELPGKLMVWGSWGKW